MRDALVFNGGGSLEFHDIRVNLIRIPEVISRVREAQHIWDALVPEPFDLANFIASEDARFLRDIKLKMFVSAVLQVGLLDRFRSAHPLPEFVMGAIDGDSALRVALGQITFLDLVVGSPAANVPGDARLHVVPVVSDSRENAVYRRSPQGDYQRLALSAMNAEPMLLELLETQEINRLILLGPGNTLFGRKIHEIRARDIQVLECIDLDPMLTWFWSRLRESRLAIAN